MSNDNSTFTLAPFFYFRVGFDTLMGELGRVSFNFLVALMCLFDDSWHKTFIHGMVIKPQEDFQVFFNFECLKIEGIVFLMLLSSM